MEDTSCVLPGMGYSSATWGDYDRDGDLDIILSGNTPDAGVAKIFRNDLGVVNTAPAAPDRDNSYSYTCLMYHLNGKVYAQIIRPIRQ